MVNALLLVSYSFKRRSHSANVASAMRSQLLNLFRIDSIGRGNTPDTAKPACTLPAPPVNLPLAATAESTPLWTKCGKELRERKPEGDSKEVQERHHHHTAAGPEHQTGAISLMGPLMVTSESQKLEMHTQTWVLQEILQLSGHCPCQGWIPHLAVLIL